MTSSHNGKPETNKAKRASTNDMDLSRETEERGTNVEEGGCYQVDGGSCSSLGSVEMSMSLFDLLRYQDHVTRTHS